MKKLTKREIEAKIKRLWQEIHYLLEEWFSAKE
jgi:hypothetical protein